MAIQPELMAEVSKVLRLFGGKYYFDEKMKKNRVIEDIQNFDHNLITALLDNKIVSDEFTEEINGKLFFKINNFIELFQYKDYWKDSYTKFANKVGLTIYGDYIDENPDIVLDFPFKDTILKASMSKDDNDSGNSNEEPFLHEVIARSEIDTLLSPKILKNVVGYGDQNNCDDCDNLIIKGNNLLSLYSIYNRFNSKIKLIYLDPPYNTKNDKLPYNDSFNQASWLTFMKNRLEVARDLLSEDGMIFIQTDDREHAYLKVLMDNIFGEDKYLNTIVIKSKSSSGVSGGGEDKRLKKNTEFILVYANPFAQINIQERDYPLSKYISERKEQGKSFAYTKVLINSGKLKKIGETIDGKNNKIELFDVQDYEIKSVSQLAKEQGVSNDEIYFKYLDKIFTTENAQTSIRTRVKNATGDEGYTIARYVPVSGKNKGNVIDVGFIGKSKRLVSFLSSTSYIDNGIVYKTEKAGTLWDDISWSSIKSEGGVELNSGKKPEKLLERIIASATEEKDWVLDFFMGSGTTQATAMKMNRRFIGMEQIDQQWNKAVNRLEGVVDGDQTGISKKVNWNGGGSFKRVELLDKNGEFIKSILKIEDQNSFIEFYEGLKETADFDFRVDLDKFIKNAKELQLDEQKKLLIRIIDKNQLYYNYSDIDDEDVRKLISDDDYRFNTKFYGKSE